MKLGGEIGRFIVAGVSAVATDSASYFVLLNWLEPSWAKAISFVLGSVVAYVINKFWTFSQQQKSGAEVLRFVALYLSTLGANVSVNALVLWLASLALPALGLSSWGLSSWGLNSWDYELGSNTLQLDKIAAFLAATGTSTVLNFIGMKFWVFKHHEN